jgi:hypothetical protein
MRNAECVGAAFAGKKRFHGCLHYSICRW